MAENGKRKTLRKRAPHGERSEQKGAPKGEAWREDAPSGSRGGRSAASRTGSAVTSRRDRPTAPRDARPVASRALYIEGRRAAAEALRTSFPVKRALIAEGQRDAGTSQYVDAFKAAGIPVDFVPRDTLEEISSHGAHQGIALEVGAFPYKAIEDVIAASGTGPALVVVLDHVTDEGNLGAIARSAEVVGAAGLVIANKRAAGVGVGTFKTSAGAVMHLPIAQVANLARAVDQLKEAGFWVVGATEHAEDIVWDAPLDGRIALVMGSEGEGISRLLLEKCDYLAKLPQRGATESLNVAQAATVFCYEWLRRNNG